MTTHTALVVVSALVTGLLWWILIQATRTLRVTASSLRIRQSEVLDNTSQIYLVLEPIPLGDFTLPGGSFILRVHSQYVYVRLGRNFPIRQVIVEMCLDHQWIVALSGKDLARILLSTRSRSLQDMANLLPQPNPKSSQVQPSDVTAEGLTSYNRLLKKEDLV